MQLLYWYYMHEHCNQWQGFRHTQPDGWVCKVKNSMAEQETTCWNRPTRIEGEGEVYNVRICIETQTHWTSLITTQTFKRKAFKRFKSDMY